jgi:hypothetical protein
MSLLRLLLRKPLPEEAFLSVMERRDGETNA